MAVRKHEKGAFFKENQRISNVFRIAGVRSTEQSVPYTSIRVINTRVINTRVINTRVINTRVIDTRIINTRVISTRVISTGIIDMRKKGRKHQCQILTGRIGIRTAKVLKI